MGAKSFFRKGVIFMKNKVRPTRKQLKTLEIKQANPNMPLGQAMKQAGYSKTTSYHPKQNFIELKGTQLAIDQFKEKLAGLGITPVFMAGKYNEWLNATKIKSSMTEPDRVVPDYETQLKVKDDVNKVLGLELEKNQGNVKKRIVAEEFFQEVTE